MSGLRAILVCVDYADLLALTLPYNLHHFSGVWVVTDGKSLEATKRVCWEAPNLTGTSITVLATELFYDRGAKFNKWAGLEWGLDAMGREGWLCVMDADVLWPKGLRWGLFPDGRSLSLVENGRESVWSPGHLISPLRRMFPTIPSLPPEEATWGRYPVHSNRKEWVGFTQIFHASDPVLGPPPWHQTDWTHAGGADSFFQAKWPQHKKVRPPFEVLHLGEAGTNWCGRVSPYADGSEPDGAEEKWKELQRMMRERKIRKGFQHEKLSRTHLPGSGA